MRIKRLLATFLLSVGLCLVPALGYGEDETNDSQRLLDAYHKLLESMTDYIDVLFLEAKVNYIMNNPNHFLRVRLHYDREGAIGRERGTKFFPVGTDTKNKVFVYVKDTRGQFSDKSEGHLLALFEAHLTVLYSRLMFLGCLMDTDVIAEFYSEDDTFLGYFYQGEYHLWEE